MKNHILITLAAAAVSVSLILCSSPAWASFALICPSLAFEGGTHFMLTYTDNADRLKMGTSSLYQKVDKTLQNLLTERCDDANDSRSLNLLVEDLYGLCRRSCNTETAAIHQNDKLLKSLRAGSLNRECESICTKTYQQQKLYAEGVRDGMNTEQQNCARNEATASSPASGAPKKTNKANVKPGSKSEPKASGVVH